MKIDTDKERDKMINWLKRYVSNIMDAYDERISCALTYEDVKTLELQRDARVKPLMSLLNGLILNTSKPSDISIKKDKQGGYKINEFSDNNSRK